MEAIITNFRRAVHHQSNNQMVILIKGVNSKEEAAKFVGKAVSWKSPAGKELKGKISSPHGNKGAVRAIFETGMPGQSVGQKIDIAN